MRNSAGYPKDLCSSYSVILSLCNVSTAMKQKVRKEHGRNCMALKAKSDLHVFSLHPAGHADFLVCEEKNVFECP